MPIQPRRNLLLRVVGLLELVGAGERGNGLVEAADAPQIVAPHVVRVRYVRRQRRIHLTVLQRVVDPVQVFERVGEIVIGGTIARRHASAPVDRTRPRPRSRAGHARPPSVPRHCRESARVRHRRSRRRAPCRWPACRPHVAFRSPRSAMASSCCNRSAMRRCSRGLAFFASSCARLAAVHRRCRGRRAPTRCGSAPNARARAAGRGVSPGEKNARLRSTRSHADS